MANEKLIELPINDAILVLEEELKQRADGYGTYLANGGKGDPAEEVSLDALAMAISALEHTKWIPVTERLPESGVHVLVACEMYGQYLHGQYVCDGFYADRYTQKVENIDYDIACEYCEEDDEYYLWQGWYEVIKNWDDYNSVVIGDTVTHWMPLPEPPKGE